MSISSKLHLSRRNVLIGLGALTTLGVGGGTWKIYLFIQRMNPVAVYQEYASGLAWSADSKSIAFGADNAVQVWDTTTNSHRMTYQGQRNPVIAVAWSPDRRYIASGSEDTTVQVWNAATGHQRLTCQGHSDWVDVVAWSPDSQRIASGSTDHTVQVWDATTGRQLLIYQGHSNEVHDVVWSPDGKRIVSDDNSTIQVWDSTTGRQLVIYQYQGSINPFFCIAWSPDSRYVAFVLNDKTVQVWDTNTGHQVSAHAGYAGWTFAGGWSPDGKQIVSHSSDRWLVQVWDAASGQEVWSYRAAPGFDNLGDVAWSPDGKYLATGWSDGRVRIFNAPF